MTSHDLVSNLFFPIFLDNLQISSCLKHHLHMWVTKLLLSSQLVLGLSIISYCPNNKTINNHFNLISDKKQIWFTDQPCFSLCCDIRIQHYSGWRQIIMSMDIFSTFLPICFQKSWRSLFASGSIIFQIHF